MLVQRQKYYAMLHLGSLRSKGRFVVSHFSLFVNSVFSIEPVCWCLFVVSLTFFFFFCFLSHFCDIFLEGGTGSFVLTPTIELPVCLETNLTEEPPRPLQPQTPIFIPLSSGKNSHQLTILWGLQISVILVRHKPAVCCGQTNPFQFHFCGLWKVSHSVFLPR